MKKLHLGAIALGCLVAAPWQASMAQSTGYVVFFDRSTGQLSRVADETIRRAAADADKSAGLVRVVGRAEYATAVKDQLVRDGVPARAIVVVPKAGNPLPTIPDGVSEPANRSVEIKY